MAYQHSLESVKTHPLPDWYNDAKFGIFIHWGIYSVPAFAPLGADFAERMLKGESGFAESPYAEWYQNGLRLKNSSTEQHHNKTYGADFRYEQFAPLFNEQVRQWDPAAWADLFAKAGARYVVLVSKHHDGFLMWNSRHANPRLPNWQATRDIVGELSRALSAKNLKLGLYYSSLLDWSFTQCPIDSLADLIAGSDTSAEYRDYVEAHWRELIERYDPWILWSDIGYPPGYHLPKLWADFYNGKPEGVINDRWLQLPGLLFNRVGRFILTQVFKRLQPGKPPTPAHADFVTPEYATLDHIAAHKWETCRGIGNSFGYNQVEDAADYQTAEALIRMLADIVSKNGNLLLNVGPRADGSLHPSQVDALHGLGAWLAVNGEAIYGTRPWTRFTDALEDAEVRYTSRNDTHYVIITKIPASGVISLPVDVLRGRVTLIETGASLVLETLGESALIRLPETSRFPVLKVHAEEVG